MVMAISILTILLSISSISAALMGIFNPTLYYAGVNMQAGIMGIIGFLALLTGGIFGICGVRNKNFKCVMVLWFCLLFISAWSYGMAITMAGVYEALATNDKLPASDRFISAYSIERVA